MRGADSYEPLHETHDLVDAVELPGLRYEPLRETEQQVEAALAAEPDAIEPETAGLIDAAEARRAALDEELTEMRALAQTPAQEEVLRAAGLDQDDGIERALALQPGAQPPAPTIGDAEELADYVAPERWTDRGGMVEHQASAMEWLEHSAAERREREARETSRGTDGLTAEQLELLDAARATETQAQQQELGLSQVQDHSGP